MPLNWFQVLFLLGVLVGFILGVLFYAIVHWLGHHECRRKIRFSQVHEPTKYPREP